MDFPAPQANDLHKVAAVVDAVSAGVDSTAGIAETIGVAARQGAYYPNAAGTLGLVERDDAFSGPGIWSVTNLGKTFANAAVADRLDILKGAVLDLDAAVVYTSGSDGPAALAQAYQDSGLAADTASRRLATIRSWISFVDAGDTSAQLIALERDAAVDRAVEVVARVRRAAQRQVRHCESCFMQLPSAATGDLCENCE